VFGGSSSGISFPEKSCWGDVFEVGTTETILIARTITGAL